MENQEVINYLLAHNDLKIIQRKDMFNFSLDTVLLSQFCTINKDVRNIVDFGTNNAAIPLLLSKRTPKKITGIEIQEEAVELAKRNVQMNDLEEQIEIIHGDIKEVVKNLPKAQLIVCNPPFFKVGEDSNLNENEYLTIARHEVKIDLEGIISSAAYLLNIKRYFLVILASASFLGSPPISPANNNFSLNNFCSCAVRIFPTWLDSTYTLYPPGIRHGFLTPVLPIDQISIGSFTILFSISPVLNIFVHSHAF